MFTGIYCNEKGGGLEHVGETTPKETRLEALIALLELIAKNYNKGE